MGAAGGTALRLLATSLYILTCLCSIVILAIYSYFLAAFSTHSVHGPNWVRAVEGIGGAAVLYTLVASIMVCFLGGVMVFAFIGIILNLLFFGGFIAIAIMARGGAHRCKGDVRTPLGNGDDQSHNGWDGAVFTPSLGTACTMNKAVFAVALLGAFLFLILAFVQLWVGRHHQREKRAAATTTTAAKGRRFKLFSRKKRAVHTKDAEAGVIPATAHHNGVHHDGAHHDGVHHNGAVDSSYNTPAMNAYQGNKYETTQTHPTTTGVPTAGGYHTGPQGTAVNPYNYDNRPVH